MRTIIDYDVMGIPCRFSTTIPEVGNHFRHIFEYLRLRGSSSPVRFRIELTRTGEKYRLAHDTKAEVYPHLPTAVLNLEFKAFQEPMQRMKGTVLFHAAWSTRGPRAFVFPGRGDSGKSTLAYGFSMQGYDFGSDEWLGFREDGSLIPFPRKILLKRGNPWIERHALRPSEKNILHKLDGRIYPDLPETGNLAKAGLFDPIFFFLTRKPEGPARCREIPTLEALEELMALCPNRKTMTPRHFQTLVSFLKPGRIFRLSFASVDEAMGKILEVAGE